MAKAAKTVKSKQPPSTEQPAPPEKAQAEGGEGEATGTKKKTKKAPKQKEQTTQLQESEAVAVGRAQKAAQTLASKKAKVEAGRARQANQYQPGAIAQALVTAPQQDAVSALFAVTTVAPTAPALPATFAIKKPAVKTEKGKKRKQEEECNEEAGEENDEEKEDGAEEEEKLKKGAKRKATEEGEGKKAKRVKTEGGASGEGDEEEGKSFDPERIKRTVFVGNLPASEALKKSKPGAAVKKFFAQYGEVESVRLRSVAYSDIKVPRQVALAQNKLHEKRSSMNAYVVFKTEEEARAALAANATLYRDKHIRVDMAGNKEHDTQKTVFVGSLPFDVEDEPLYEKFGECGAVQAVRVIRDKRTNVGKGIAYVTFQEKSSVGLAVRLNGTKFQGRTLRVSRAMDKERVQAQKNGMKGSKKGVPSFQGARANSQSSLNRKMVQGLKKKTPVNTGGSKKTGSKKRPHGKQQQHRIAKKMQKSRKA
eukprot:comp21735_c0_seq1/m.30746 comp21735_c0_seq1/g.30746  ORF comp21735_c0_seq1/g.30746 comp21735_c0_seq1/m.30746 type:complete len:480 (-) comp21735_c0_seq1:407-1846(-)